MNTTRARERSNPSRHLLPFAESRTVQRDILYIAILILVLLFASRAAVAGEGDTAKLKLAPPSDEISVGRSVNGYMVAGYILAGVSVISFAGAANAISYLDRLDDRCHKNRNNCDQLGRDFQSFGVLGTVMLGALAGGGATILLAIGYDEYEKSGVKMRVPATSATDVIHAHSHVDSVVVGMKGTF